MNPDVERTAKELLADISLGKNFTENSSPHELMTQADNMIGRLAFLVGPLIDAESNYRKEVIALEEVVTDGKKMSHASAEAKAKGGEAYKIWRKLDMVYKLAEERIKLIKKFTGALQEEYHRA